MIEDGAPTPRADEPQPPAGAPSRGGGDAPVASRTVAPLSAPSPPPQLPSRGASSGTTGVVARQGEAVVLLSKVNMFAGLQTAYLRRIAAIGVREQHERGTTIFPEGAVGDKMYLILSGAVRISRQMPGIGEEALAVLRPGNYFGEMSLIDDSPRSADAKAHEASELFVIRKEDLEDLLFVDRDLAYDLLWSFVRTLTGRLRESNDKLTLLTVSNRF